MKSNQNTGDACMSYILGMINSIKDEFFYENGKHCKDSDVVDFLLLSNETADEDVAQKNNEVIAYIKRFD